MIQNKMVAFELPLIVFPDNNMGMNDYLPNIILKYH
jgi:hypothetical protein